jgi:hypothetical protein
MRKTILLVFLLLSLVAVPAMAVTFASVTGTLGSGTASITGVDNSVLYLGTAKGNIYSQNISTGAFTKLANVGEAITAIVYPGATYTYVGTSKGHIYRHTISGNAISKTVLATCSVPDQAIAGMKWDATLSQIWFVTNKGKTYSCKP